MQRTSDAIAQITPDIESYVALQRSEGFSRVLFALVIFAHGLQLPDEQKYWSLSALTEAAGDSIFYAMVGLIYQLFNFYAVSYMWP